MVSLVEELDEMEPSLEVDGWRGRWRDGGWNAPTIDDLNRETEREFDRAGVRETTDEDRARVEPRTAAGRLMVQDDRGRLADWGIHRMLVIRRAG